MPRKRTGLAWITYTRINELWRESNIQGGKMAVLWNPIEAGKGHSQRMGTDKQSKRTNYMSDGPVWEIHKHTGPSLQQYVHTHKHQTVHTIWGHSWSPCNPFLDPNFKTISHLDILNVSNTALKFSNFKYWVWNHIERFFNYKKNTHNKILSLSHTYNI